MAEIKCNIKNTQSKKKKQEKEKKKHIKEPLKHKENKMQDTGPNSTHIHEKEL